MPLFPFNILAPITLGRRGAKGDTGEPGTPAPANTWENITGKPSTFPAANVGDNPDQILKYHDGSGSPTSPTRFVMRHPTFGVTHVTADYVRDDVLEAAKKTLVQTTPPNGGNEIKATATLTVISVPSVPQTITIEGLVLTFANSLSATLITDIPRGLFDTASQAATAIANTINNNYRRLNLMSVASGAVVTLYSVMDGNYGNISNISSSTGNVVASGSTLSGGSFRTTTATPADQVGQTCIVANHVFICTQLSPTIIWKRI